MQLEKQVCSLELAKKLKELGVEQDSYFSWIYVSHDQEWKCGDAINDRPFVSAFTVAELGEIIEWSINRGEWYIHIAPKFSADGSWVLWFEDEDGEKNKMYPDGRWYITDKNEADARAKMLIYLLENNLSPLPTSDSNN